jgi:hypothetical protein
MTSTIKVDNIQNQCGANIINESSNTITIGASGDTVTLASGASQSGFGRTGTVDWQTSIKTTNFTAVNGEGYFVNTTSGAITVTLPASPSVGNIVAIADYAGTAGTNAITIGRNGSNFEGGTTDGGISIDRQTATFVYADATQGWVVVNSNDASFILPEFVAATGGTVTTCGNFKIHSFTGPGTFCVSSAGNPLGSTTVDYMVVAGGGGGGVGCSGGGGGAGGWRASDGTASGCYSAGPSPLVGCVSALPVTVQGYPITVGGGGSGRSPFTGPSFPSPAKGASGSNSIFSTITSAGGGGGGGNNEQPGIAGGSGGGAAHSGGTLGNGNTPPVSPPQGNPGAAPASGGGPAPSDAGGAGGGATAAGTPGPTNHSGGDGATTSISGSSTTYAGGGGGANRCAGDAADVAGGSGGGGRGSFGSRPTPPSNTAGQNGTDNTGGGGGAGKARTADPSNRPYGGSGTGGSGIVIIRYKYQ